MRFKSLTYTPISSQRSELPLPEIVLDPLCSRSFTIVSTLEYHFPSFLKKTYPKEKPSRSIFENGTLIKPYECVKLPLVFEDTTGQELKIEVEVRVSQAKEVSGNGGLDGKVVLGKDFWGREDVEVWWFGDVKMRENKKSWWGWGKEKSEGFLGLVVEEKMVRFKLE